MMSRGLICGLLLAAAPLASAEDPTTQGRTADATATDQAAVLSPPVSWRAEGRQTDFPALAIDAQGTTWIVAVEWNGEQDTLALARHVGGVIERVCSVGQPGIIHQPAIAADADGGLVVVWSQVNASDVMELKARRFRDGAADGGEITLGAAANGGNVLAAAATDRQGRVWVTWQSLRGGLSDIFCRTYDPAAKTWSPEVQVTHDPAGDWEPCLAFDDRAGAWVLFDSSRGNEFNIYAVRVGLDGTVGKAKPLIKTERYEARASAASSADGKTIWLACERGNTDWGLDSRGHANPAGLNGRRNTVFARWDVATDTVEELSAVDRLLTTLPPPVPNTSRPRPRGNSAKAQLKAEVRDAERAVADTASKAAGEPQSVKPVPPASINLPQLTVDGRGRPWMTVRYFKDYCWQIALARYDVDTARWTAAVSIPSSAYTQDRRSAAVQAADGGLWLAWPSDLRTSKAHRTSGIALARLDPAAVMPVAGGQMTGPPEAYQPRPPYIHPVTPERPREERHTWTHGGTTYRLYWGDFHRHTDISNCRTSHDGCVLEQFRYALDMGKLDMLGTSDHTDIAKIYHPYEWWLNQKMSDVFFVPGFFNSMYAYEREQPWPAGHRNVIFAARGGPIVYVQRVNYLASPWRATLPLAAAGPPQISPQELWDVLARCGTPVTVMSHTGATGMGVDWNAIDRIDHRVENVIEIFQGARVAYEAQNAPQPTVGLRQRERYTPDAPTIGTPLPGDPIRGFTGKENGLYQNALARGHKLGVWANSDHISTHTSFGGVYVRDFTREGIIEGINARRTIATTDKIFVEFTCNGRMLGSEIESTAAPTLAWKIAGTADVKQVTLVRNEEDYRQWQSLSRTVAETFVDDAPLAGENRYYLRIEQTDGNMAWSSPIWVTFRQP